MQTLIPSLMVRRVLTRLQDVSMSSRCYGCMCSVIVAGHVGSEMISLPTLVLGAIPIFCDFDWTIYNVASSARKTPPHSQAFHSHLVLAPSLRCQSPSPLHHAPPGKPRLSAQKADWRRWPTDCMAGTVLIWLVRAVRLPEETEKATTTRT
jgi:hypothetical protein